MMTQHIKNVVLVHGAFADGSGWKRVADILKNDGYKVSVAQPPETSYADDQKYTKPAIIQTLRRLSILPRLPSMKVRAVRRSNRPCHKRQRRSLRTATGSGGSTRRISWPTSLPTFHGMKLSSWL